jgi:hypothetical protein
MLGMSIIAEYAYSPNPLSSHQVQWPPSLQFHRQPARKRRPGDRCEDAGKIVSRANIYVFGVGGVRGEVERLLKLNTRGKRTQEQYEKHGKSAAQVEIA